MKINRKITSQVLAQEKLLKKVYINAIIELCKTIGADAYDDVVFKTPLTFVKCKVPVSGCIIETTIIDRIHYGAGFIVGSMNDVGYKMSGTMSFDELKAIYNEIKEIVKNY